VDPDELVNPETLANTPLTRYADRIVFEITERVRISGLEALRFKIKSLRRLGFRFAIDDLGAGYASLNAVALLEPDFIKIDGVIIRGMTRASPRAKLVRRIVEFANDADIRVIAESVETAAEAEFAHELGCHYLQGYYLGRPQREVL